MIPTSTLLTGHFNLALDLLLTLLFLFGLAGALSIALSATYVGFRDFAITSVVLAQVTFYATPIHLRAGRDLDPRRSRGADCRPGRRRPPRSAGARGRAIFLAVCAFGVWIFCHEGTGNRQVPLRYCAGRWRTRSASIPATGPAP